MSDKVHDGDDYPRTWNWQKDGPRITGRYRRFETAKTRDGDKPVLVLEHEGDGAERTIWLDATVLRNKLKDEIRQRPTRDLEPGELVTIERGAEKKTSAMGNDYWPFPVVHFEHAVIAKPLDVLDATDDEDDEPRPAYGGDLPVSEPDDPSPAPDDPMPF